MIEFVMFYTSNMLILEKVKLPYLQKPLTQFFGTFVFSPPTMTIFFPFYFILFIQQTETDKKKKVKVVACSAVPWITIWNTAC